MSARCPNCGGDLNTAGVMIWCELQNLGPVIANGEFNITCSNQDCGYRFEYKECDREQDDPEPSD